MKPATPAAGAESSLATARLASVIADDVLLAHDLIEAIAEESADPQINQRLRAGRNYLNKIIAATDTVELLGTNVPITEGAIRQRSPLDPGLPDERRGIRGVVCDGGRGGLK